MRRQHTTKTGKAMRMKFSCIISACPEGARKWHIQISAMFYIAKTIGRNLIKKLPKRERLRKEVLSLQAFVFSRNKGFHRTIKLKGSIQLVSLSVNFSYCTINQITGFCSWYRALIKSSETVENKGYFVICSRNRFIKCFTVLTTHWQQGNVLSLLPVFKKAYWQI